MSAVLETQGPSRDHSRADVVGLFTLYISGRRQTNERMNTWENVKVCFPPILEPFPPPSSPPPTSCSEFSCVRIHLHFLFWSHRWSSQSRSCQACHPCEPSPPRTSAGGLTRQHSRTCRREQNTVLSRLYGMALLVRRYVVGGTGGRAVGGEGAPLIVICFWSFSAFRRRST